MLSRSILFISAVYTINVEEDLAASFITDFCLCYKKATYIEKYLWLFYILRLLFIGYF